MTGTMTVSSPLPRSNSPARKFIVPSVCFLLALAVFTVFGRTCGYGFVNYDDDKYFTANYHVQAGLTWKGVLWAFQTGHAGNWHPLTWLSLMLDAQLFGTGPAGPHLTNVILHAANAILLFLLLRRLMGFHLGKNVGAAASPANALWVSAFVAAVFAVHPLRVESVAWVSERKDVLSGLFFMLTLLMYVQYVEQSQVQGSRFKVFYGLTLLFFALGLMSKPMLVTVPFLLLLLDYWPLNRFGSATVNVQPLPKRILQLVLEKLPFFLLSAASCTATILAQRQAIKAMNMVPLTLRLENAVISYVTYIVQLVWPEKLAALYPYHFDIPAWQIVGAGAALFVITSLGFLTARRFPYFLTGWLWYLGMLVPVIGLVQVGDQAHADRYTYLPQIGLCLVIVLAIRDLTASWRWRRPVLTVASFGVIAALMVCAWKQTSYWRSDKALWEHALACTSGNFTAQNNLGYMLAAQGQTSEAIEHYQMALKINPDCVECENNLGTAFLRQGQLDKALGCFQQALAIDPAFAEAHNNLGNLLAKEGRITEAIGQYRKAIEFKPDRAEFYNNLGNLLAVQRQPAEAIRQFQKALEIDPHYAKAHYNLANVFFAQGRWDQAIEHYQQALKRMPDSIPAHYQLGLALQCRGRFADAIKQFQKVLELNPLHAAAQNDLAWILATCPESSLRNGQKAVALARQAAQLSASKSPQILDTLAAAYAEAGQFSEAIRTARQALALSVAQNNKPMTEVIQNHLRLFENHSPCREKP
jgi:protein O-mannosyl-transferase